MLNEENPIHGLHHIGEVLPVYVARVLQRDAESVNSKGECQPASSPGGVALDQANGNRHPSVTFI